MAHHTFADNGLPYTRSANAESWRAAAEKLLQSCGGPMTCDYRSITIVINMLLEGS
jgi:hypothetical protein